MILQEWYDTYCKFCRRSADEVDDSLLCISPFSAGYQDEGGFVVIVDGTPIRAMMTILKNSASRLTYDMYVLDERKQARLLNPAIFGPRSDAREKRLHRLTIQLLNEYAQADMSNPASDI